MRTLSLVLLFVAAPVLLPAAAAQDALEEAKSQYSAAEYEAALSTLTRAAEVRPVNRVELEQYRAFCLIALGRPADAERAIAALVSADPMYVPSESVASPKVLTLVSEMRRKELPAVARQLLDDGRVAFKEKDFVEAQQHFDLLREVLEDPAMKGRPESEDLRMLADGFAALTVAVAAPAPAPAPAAAAAAPAPAPVQADTVTEAVALEQEVPVWIPPNPIAGSREYSGAIKVLIGADGRVKSTTIERPTHPSYDARLVHMSRQWLYKPATRNGEAVESERVIAVKLSPRG
jgi:tetratricopeptide (TPR) repeat protein